jgi:hypothetical protein
MWKHGTRSECSRRFACIFHCLYFSFAVLRANPYDAPFTAGIFRAFFAAIVSAEIHCVPVQKDQCITRPSLPNLRMRIIESHGAEACLPSGSARWLAGRRCEARKWAHAAFNRGGFAASEQHASAGNQAGRHLQVPETADCFAINECQVTPHQA